MSVPIKPSSLSEKDSRIMLRLLVTEAQQYQVKHSRGSSRNNSPTPSNEGSLESSLDAAESATSLARAQHQSLSPNKSPTWCDLHHHIDDQWEAWDGESRFSTEAKYSMLKSRLTSLFLWESPNHSHEDTYDAPPARLQRHPQQILGEIAERQRQRLSLIPEGKLFL